MTRSNGAKLISTRQLAEALRFLLAGLVALQVLLHSSSAGAQESGKDLEKRYHSGPIRFMGFGKRSSSEELSEDPLIGKGFRMGFGKRQGVDERVSKFHMGFGKRAVANPADLDGAEEGPAYMRGFRMGFGKRAALFDPEDPSLQRFTMGLGRR